MIGKSITAVFLVVLVFYMLERAYGGRLSFIVPLHVFFFSFFAVWVIAYLVLGRYGFFDWWRRK